MPVEIIDLPRLAREQKSRKVVVCMHRCIIIKPGERDDMHCHNADQTFYVIEGECTRECHNETRTGRDDHGRIFLPAGKQRRRSDDHDGNRFGLRKPSSTSIMSSEKTSKNSAKRNWSAPNSLSVYAGEKLKITL